jgi:hypothetical protein
MQEVLIADDYADKPDCWGRQIESLGFLPILAADGKDVLDKPIRRKAAVDPDGPDDAGYGWLGSAQSSGQPRNQGYPGLGSNGVIPSIGSQHLHRTRLQ